MSKYVSDGRISSLLALLHVFLSIAVSIAMSFPMDGLHRIRIDAVIVFLFITGIALMYYAIKGIKEKAPYYFLLFSTFFILSISLLAIILGKFMQ
jgi:hypothetical protein